MEEMYDVLSIFSPPISLSNSSIPRCESPNSVVDIVGFANPGKIMTCDLRNIKKPDMLNNFDNICKVLDIICIYNNFNIIQKIYHEVSPLGYSIIYILSECHISLYSFPEKNYIAFDIYTCRYYENNSVYFKIYDFLVEAFDADYDSDAITVIDRSF